VKLICMHMKNQPSELDSFHIGRIEERKEGEGNERGGEEWGRILKLYQKHFVIGKDLWR